MSVALQLYQQLRNAPDEESRSKAIADAFEQLEERYPNLKDVATQGQVRETELRLQKEILTVQGNLRETELRLQKEIKEVEMRLSKDIKDVEVRLTQTINRQTYWIIGSVGTVIGFIRVLDWLLASLPK
jgi:predicted phage-related endonuclease